MPKMPAGGRKGMYTRKLWARVCQFSFQGLPEPLALSPQGCLCMREGGEEEAAVQKLSLSRDRSKKREGEKNDKKKSQSRAWAMQTCKEVL